MANESRRRRPPMDSDEPDEAPTRRRIADDGPPRRRRRPEPEEEYGDEEQEDVEEAPRPSRRAASRRANATGPRRTRGPGGRDDRRRPTASSRRVASGWGGYNKVKAAHSDFETKFKPGPEGTVVAPLELEPFAAFARHWLDLQDGKRAFICPSSLEADDDGEDMSCPLCDVGDRPNPARAYLNVAVLRPHERPELAVWEIGASVSEQLQMIDKSIGRRTSLTDIYILASSKGSGLNTKYHLEPLYPEDLDEFEVDELTDKQRSAFELYDADLYEIPSLSELDKVADEIA